MQVAEEVAGDDPERLPDQFEQFRKEGETDAALVRRLTVLLQRFGDANEVLSPTDRILVFELIQANTLAGNWLTK